MEATRPKPKKKKSASRPDVTVATAAVDSAEMAASNELSEVERQLMDATQEDLGSVGSSFTRLSVVDSLESNIENLCTELTEFSMITFESPVTAAAETVIKESNQNNIPDIEVEEDSYTTYHIKTINTSSKYGLAKYVNTELEENIEFEKTFNETQKNPNFMKELTALLHGYIEFRKSLSIIDQMLVDLRNRSDDLLKEIWILERVALSEAGECQDGNPVSATAVSEIANFSALNHVELKHCLSDLRQQMEQRVTASFHVELARQQINSLLAEKYDLCVIEVNQNIQRVQLHPDAQGFFGNAEHLRGCISVLFFFYRNYQDDSDLCKELEEWIIRLNALFLLKGTAFDQIYFLHHVLRCPPNINNSIIRLIQIPTAIDCANLRLDDPIITHSIAMLGIILSPVSEREAYLEKLSKETTNSWVILEMDGDCGAEATPTTLTEEDLNNLLAQIPLEHLFREIFNIQSSPQKNGKFRHKIDRFKPFDHKDFEELLSLSVFIVSLFERGLRTYHKICYKQFAKKLCCYIGHILKHITDVRDIYRSALKTDICLWERLQEQYDTMFEKSIQAIFSSRDLGAWQFLTTLPYGQVSKVCLWSLYYKLHGTFNQDFTDTVPIEEVKVADLVNMFSEIKDLVAVDEVYYLLSTFAAMALDCKDTDPFVEVNPLEQDMIFIEFVVIDLVKIGMICERTKETCLKSVRILLANICNEFPTMISVILSTMDSEFDRGGDDAMYLFQGLPLITWPIKLSDLDILGRWLVGTHLLSLQHNLSRYILVNLNYGFRNNDLFLGHDAHCTIALMIAEAVMRLAPEPSVGGSTMSTVSSYVRNQANEMTLKNWAWSMIVRLHLHVLDWDYRDGRNVMFIHGTRNRSLDSIPNLYEEPKLKVLSRGVLDGQPFACYVATLLTEWGHSVPEICQRGFAQLELVLRHGRHTAVIFALQFIVPLFIECPESLAKSDKFLSVLMGILMSDKTYLKMAKNLISSDQPEYVLEMCRMVVQQFNHYRSFKLISPAALVRVWFKSLICLPNWNSEPCILLLMDNILMTTFTFPPAIAEAKEILHNYRSRLTDDISEALIVRPTQSVSGTGSSAMGSIIGWMAPPNPYARSLMQTETDQNAVWFATLAIEIDEEAQQGIYEEMLKFLCKGYDTNIETALKKASLSGEVPIPSSTTLAVYRWAHQAVVTPNTHPLLPYICQRFFTLFLQRVKMSPDLAVQTGGVGNKLFLSKYSGLMKYMKAKLRDCEEHFSEMMQSASSSKREPVGDLELCKSLKSLFQTYQLWIGEPRLFDHTLQLHSLPVIYESRKLTLIFNEKKEMWTEYMDLQALQLIKERMETAWNQVQHRAAEWHNPAVAREPKKHPLNTLVLRLKSYDMPLEPTFVKMLPLNMLPLMYAFDRFKIRQTHMNAEFEDLISDFTELCDNILNRALKVVQAEAKRYEYRNQGHCAVDVTLLDLVKRLYHNGQREIVLPASCQSSPTHERRNCAGPATVRFLVNEAYVEESVRVEIEENREQFRQAYIAGVSPMSEEVGYSLLQFDSYYREFLHLIRETQAPTCLLGRRRAIAAIGLNGFQSLLSMYTEDLSRYPPTCLMFSKQLSKLASAFLVGDSVLTMGILDTMLEKEYILKVLSTNLVPSKVSSVAFLEMYYLVVNSLSSRNPECCFVCLSKFDIFFWVKDDATTVNARSTLLQFIFKIFNNVGPNPRDSYVPVVELMVTHVMLILRHTFPEHFGEVLNHLLEGSAKQTLAPSLWMNFLQSLMNPVQSAHFMAMDSPRARMHEFASTQTLQPVRLLVDTAKVLNNHFTMERQQFGLHGLYPKYQLYVEPMMKFICAIMSRLVVATLNEDRGSPTDALCNVIWPSIELVFWPWVAPCAVPVQAPDWIEQLSTRSRLMPWTPTHLAEATGVVTGLTELIQFILDTLPGCGTPLNYLWAWYVTKFAVATVTSEVLTLIHQSWSQLPWGKFYPTVWDMKTMLTVVLELGNCRSFVGTIYTSVQWAEWIGKVMFTCDNETTMVIHVCFLHSIVKLVMEKSFQQSTLAMELVNVARGFNWHTVDSVSFGTVLDSWVTCDPRVVLASPLCSPLEVEVLHLLLIAAPLTVGNSNQILNPTSSHKRVLLIRAMMKMFAHCVVDEPRLAADGFPLLLLDRIDAVATGDVTTSQDIVDCKLLMREILVHANKPGTPLAEALVNQIAEWLKKKNFHSTVLKATLSIICTDISDHNAVGIIMETALDSFFCEASDNGTPTWDMASGLMGTWIRTISPQLDDSLISKGYVLSMFALHYTREKASLGMYDLVAESNRIQQLLELIKKREVRPVEVAKMVLLWSVILTLIERQARIPSNATATKENLGVLISHLTEESIKKFDPWCLLGLVKNTNPSLSYRTLSRVMALYLLAQMPEFKGTVVLRLNEDDPGALVPSSSMQQFASYSRNTNNINATNLQEETSRVIVTDGPVATSDARKGLRELELLTEQKSHSELKAITSEAVTIIRNSKNTLTDSTTILGQLANAYFHCWYIQGLK